MAPAVRSLLVALLALVALPATAAADLTVSTQDPGMVIVQDPGEADNDVRASKVGDDIVIEDAAGGVSALSPCTESAANTVSCPAAGVTSVLLLLEGGNDRLRLALPDHLAIAQTGDGDDVIHADNDAEELGIHCGGGVDDRIDVDNSLDPYAMDCETIAPELEGPFTLDLDPRVGGAATLTLPEITGTLASPPRIEWYRCAVDCLLIEDVGPMIVGRTLTDEFAGHSVYAVLWVQNKAGQAIAHTPRSAVVGALPPLPPPPGPYGDYGDYGDYIDPLGTTVLGILRKLARGFDGSDPRAIARRRSIPHRVTFPGTGQIAFRWTATQAGSRAAAAKRITIARGRRTGPVGGKRIVAVRPTKRGRRILRRARTLRVTLMATFKGDAATYAKETRTFRLKRRRR